MGTGREIEMGNLPTVLRARALGWSLQTRFAGSKGSSTERVKRPTVERIEGSGILGLSGAQPNGNKRSR